MKRSTILIGALIATLALHAWCVYEIYAASGDVVGYVKSRHSSIVDRCLAKYAAVNPLEFDDERTHSSSGGLIPVTLTIGEGQLGNAPDLYEMEATYSAGMPWRWIEVKEGRIFGMLGWLSYGSPTPIVDAFADSSQAYQSMRIDVHWGRAGASFASTWFMLALAGLAFNWLGLTAIRRYRRSRHRCEYCGYAAVGAGPTCPECGRIR